MTDVFGTLSNFDNPKAPVVPERNYTIDSLTSLRFVAAMMIVYHHSYAYFGTSADFFRFGSGVNFFFVLSGFILAFRYPVLKGSTAVKKFIISRIARIWPMHIAALVLLVMTHSGPFFTTDSWENYVIVATNILLVQALIPIREYYFSLNAVSWSLSAELFFCLAFPVLLVGMKRQKTITLLVLGAFILVNITIDILFVAVTNAETGLDQIGLIYISPIVRLLEFYAGMLACALFRRFNRIEVRNALIIFTALEAIAIYLVYAANVFPRPLHVIFDPTLFMHESISPYFALSTPSLTFVLFVLVFAFQRGVISRLLKKWLFVWLGSISYSLYLIHTIVLEWFKPFSGAIGTAALFSLYLVTSILLSGLFYTFVETPCRNVIKKLFVAPSNNTKIARLSV